MYQPGLGSILKASRPLMLNNSAYAPGPAPDAQAEGAPLNVYSSSASAVAACLPLSVKFYDAQRSGQVLQAFCGALESPNRSVPGRWVFNTLGDWMHRYRQVTRACRGARTRGCSTRCSAASTTQATMSSLSGPRRAPVSEPGTRLLLCSAAVACS